jgi:hypothetical protein
VLLEAAGDVGELGDVGVEPRFGWSSLLSGREVGVDRLDDESFVGSGDLRELPSLPT